jgi:hypothetical protein
MAPQTNLQARNLKRLLTDKMNMENNIEALDNQICGKAKNQEFLAHLRQQRGVLMECLCEIEKKINCLYNDPGELRMKIQTIEKNL